MFRQHYEKMYNLARSILSDDDESKDVVSEVFTTILADDVVLMPESEKGFLIRSVRNPIVFDYTELGDVVSQLAAFYHVKVEFGKAESQHIRIFFNWDKTKALKQNLEILNAFERIQITEVDGILKVE